MKKFLVFGVGLVVYILLMTLVIVPYVYEADIMFSGDKVFLTQEEYEDFKVDLKNRVLEDNLKLKSYEVLASEPPIIVSFSVVVPYDYDLSQASPAVSRGLSIFINTFLSIILFFAIVVIPAVLPAVLTWRLEE